MRLPAKILVPTDFSPASSAALSMAVELARVGGGTVTLLHTFEPPVYSLGTTTISDPAFEARFEAGARTSLAELALTHVASGVPITWLLRTGETEEEILATAEAQKVDLIVMATHHGRRARNGLGSVAESVLRNGRRPTLVIPDER